MPSLAACLRGLKARGYSKVTAPLPRNGLPLKTLASCIREARGHDQIEGEPDFTTDIDRAIERGQTWAPIDEEYTLDEHNRIWMLPLCEWSEPYWVGVPSPPPRSRKTVWERLLEEG